MSDRMMVKEILQDMTTLIELEREIMDAASSAGDEGTNDMVNAFMQFKEKSCWMLRAFIGNEK
jgi:starvation-inducible DNA-binding protein